MSRHTKWLGAILLMAGAAAGAAAQPPYPWPRPVPQAPVGSPLDGQWFFRGDFRRPCFVQSVNGPRGPGLLFTNENGTDAFGWLSHDGRRVTIPDWNLTGTIRGNSIVWPNGDFWSR
jgi:hypothetical protein